MSEEIWRKPKVLDTIGMKSTWLHDAVKKGEFPSPIKLGERAVGWRSSDIAAWLNTREIASALPTRNDEHGGEVSQ